MINVVISLIFILSGFKLLFESRKRHNIYLAVGFVLYGLQFLIQDYSIGGYASDIFFNIPRLLGSLCIMMGAVFFLRGGLK